MDTTSLTKRLKIEIDGWPSLGELKPSEGTMNYLKRKWNLENTWQEFILIIIHTR
mgnify:CR=1 FL=1